MQNTQQQKVTLEVKKYPKLIEALAKENFNIKTLLGLLGFLLLLNTFITVYLLKKGPEVIALQPSGEVAKIDLKVSDKQIETAVKEYVSYRYVWSFDKVKDQLKLAEFFVAPELLTSFRKSMLEVLKFVQEKKVTQRVYPKDIQVDLKTQSVSISLDRITEFEQLKAATEMKLVLNFSIQDRTHFNPWGVYITKEAEKVAQ